VAEDLGLQAFTAEGTGEFFVVVAPGVHQAQSFAAGDVLWCDGPAETGEAVVLVARGHGRPRLGTANGSRFLGDRGEPCHPDRWRVAGGLRSTAAAPHHPWVRGLMESAQRASSAGDASGRGGAGGRGGRPPAAHPPAAQLTLFG
jgi:hypothetical protein